MNRRETSFGLCVLGAGLIAFGNGTVIGILFALSGLYGLWNSNNKAEKTCADHILASIRSKVAKRFPVTE